MSAPRVTRRNFTSIAAGFAVGTALAGHARPAGARGATPAAGTVGDSATPVAALAPVGFISVRLRTVASEEARSQVNERVLSDFIPEVEVLEGFQGYTLSDVIEQPEVTLAIVVLEDDTQIAPFDAVGAEFVSGLEADVSAVATTEWTGDVLIATGPGAAVGTPAVTLATPVADVPFTDGYVALRVRTGTPGTDATDIAPLVASSFVPQVSALPGFRGYLWFPIEGGRVTLSFFDTEEAAEASNELGIAWAVENVPEYTQGTPEVYNATVVYQDMPIFG